MARTRSADTGAGKKERPIKKKPKSTKHSKPTARKVAKLFNEDEDLITRANDTYAKAHRELGRFAFSTKHSEKHQKLRASVLKSFIDHIVEVQSEHLLPQLLEQVFHEGKQVPYVISALSGATTLAKRKLANSLLVRWSLDYKPKRPRKSMEFYQPGTQAAHVRVLLAVLKDLGWEFNFKSDFNFEGGFQGVFDAMIQERQKKVGGNYGVQKKAILVGAESVKDLNLHVFDLDDPEQLLEFNMVVFSSYYGFRGSSEHAQIEVRNIKKDKFGPGHPLAGKEFFTLQEFSHKTERLTFYNPTLKESETGMRIPCDTPQGKGIQRLLDSLGPGQMRLYCKVATNAQRHRFAAIGHEKAVFSPNQPIGVNKVQKYLKRAASRLGFENTTGHAFRRLFVTTLVNDSGVSTEEALVSSRHASVAASRAYQIRGNNSEMGKFRALGLVE